MSQRQQFVAAFLLVAWLGCLGIGHLPTKCQARQLPATYLGDLSENTTIQVNGDPLSESEGMKKLAAAAAAAASTTATTPTPPQTILIVSPSPQPPPPPPPPPQATLQTTGPIIPMLPVVSSGDSPTGVFKCQKDSLLVDVTNNRLNLSGLRLDSADNGQVKLEECLRINETDLKTNINYTIQLDLGQFFLGRPKNEMPATIGAMLVKKLIVVDGKPPSGPPDHLAVRPSECSGRKICHLYGMMEALASTQSNHTQASHCAVGDEFATTDLKKIEAVCNTFTSKLDDNSTAQAPNKGGYRNVLAFLIILVIIGIVVYCLSSQLCMFQNGPQSGIGSNQVNNNNNNNNNRDQQQLQQVVVKDTIQTTTQQQVTAAPKTPTGNGAVKSSLGNSTEKSGAKLKSALQSQKSVGGGGKARDGTKASKSKTRSKEKSNKSKKSSTKTTSPIAPKSPANSVGKSSKKSKTG